MLPLSSSMEFTLGAELAIALALGVGFGFCLERAGFGSARKLSQLQDNLASLDFTLTDEQLQRLDAASAIELGFPHDFLASEGVQQVIYGNTLPLIDHYHTRS